MRLHAHALRPLAAATFALFTTAALAQYDPPAGYYSSAEGKSGTALRTALQTITQTGHVKLTYANVWNALQAADEDPNNTANILCIYTNRSIPKSARDGSSSASIVWNREHSWPKSYGFDAESFLPYTDVHHLFACEKVSNSTRNNRYYDFGGTSTLAPVGTSSVNRYDSDSWETWDGRKGDCARAMFYMDVRYAGQTSTQPNLVLGDTTTSTGQARMAKLSTLLAWHVSDPVSATERRRNHIIYTSWQKNRNPFIDRPEFVNLVFGGATATPTPTPTPTATATATPTPTPTSTPTGGTIALTSGVAKSDSVAKGAWDYFTIVVPANATALDVVMTGTNDADLYVRQGANPTTGTFTKSSTGSTSSETVSILKTGSPALVTGTTYHIGVYGYSTSTASYTITAVVTTGSTATPTPTPTPTATATPGGATTTTLATNVSVAQGAWKNYQITVPTGKTSMVVNMTGTGDADLYIRRGSSYPTLSAYDFRPYLDGSNETVTINGSSSPVLYPGQTYWISAYGYTAATVTLKATIQ